MYYTVYKITNIINGKIYIGKHKTNNLDDGYFGSGKTLKRAIIKYGIENFIKEYIKIFDNEEDMNILESKIVNPTFVANPSTYNLKIGGEGGFDYINNNKLHYSLTNSDKHLDNWMTASIKGGEAFRKKLSSNNLFRENFSKKVSSACLGQKNFLGKKHSDSTKLKIGKANSIKQKGVNNSQYGTCWINDGNVNKKVKKETLDIWIELGYKIGRIK